MTAYTVPGIAALARVASRFGDVRVVAPDIEQSSASHAITAARPLTYRRAAYIPGIESWRVNGTPADCVALGVHNWDHVDIVLSGINQGVNLGNGIWHSGTLAAAKQATLFGIRGIALSAPSVGPGGARAGLRRARAARRARAEDPAGRPDCAPAQRQSSAERHAA